MGHKFYPHIRNLFVVLGVVFFLIFINPVHKFVTTSDWSRSEGTITDSRWVSDDSGLLKIYRVTVLFDYHVDGRLYRGNNVNYGVAANEYLFKRFAQAVVDRYPVGKTVPVFFNPSDPEDEIVERSPMGGFSIVWIFLAMSCFTFAIVITIREKEYQATLNRPKVGSLRLRAQSGEDVMKDFYPSAIYNPPSPSDKADTETESSDVPKEALVDKLAGTARAKKRGKKEKITEGA